jgi:hypothetical protein
MATEHYSLPFSIAIEAAGFLLVAGSALCHELGHALAARSCSVLVRRFVFGKGPLLLQWRWGITDIEWRLYPFTGYVLTYPILRSRKLARMIVTAGGAATNLAIAGTIYALVGPALLAHAKTTIVLLAQITVVMQLIYAVLTLAPRHHRTTSGPVTMSDGMSLWRHATEPKPDLAAALAQYLARLQEYAPVEPAEALRSSAAPTIMVWLVAAAGADPAKTAPAWDQVERLRISGRLSEVEEMAVLDARLTAALTACEDTPVEQLDTWSERLIALNPTAAAAIETRAAVLIQLGQHAAGKRMLAPLEPAKSVYGSVLRLLFLAQAEHGLGNDGEARTSLAAAHKLADASPFSPWPRPLFARTDGLLAQPPETAARSMLR